MNFTFSVPGNSTDEPELDEIIQPFIFISLLTTLFALPVKTFLEQLRLFSVFHQLQNEILVIQRLSLPTIYPNDIQNYQNNNSILSQTISKPCANIPILMFHKENKTRNELSLITSTLVPITWFPIVHKLTNQMEYATMLKN